ncbi:MAG: hypothetical protein IJI07_06780 [Flexilinea sp.]|nr:hypothetical protein [Flexilinea sp.]
MQKGQLSVKQKVIVFLFFAVFLAAGLKIYDDYGPVSEEKNQIDAGHIIWAYITGDDSHYPDLPDLDKYMNRYYGQGATFATVLLEALSGFRWDVFRIWKVRRLWNFFSFFAAAICLFHLIRVRYKSFSLPFLAVLNLILLPRMFPEIFYNDRDPLFLSWLIFFFFSMILFINRTNLLTAFLLGSVTAVTVSVRMFGFILLIPLLLVFIRYPSKRRKLLLVFFVFVVCWYALNPIAWKDPLGTVKTSIIHLTTKQRLIDTQGSSDLLFAGKFYPEQDLPWFYLPLWILISTPLMLLIFALWGGIKILPSEKNTAEDDPFVIVDFSLATFFILFIVGIPLIRPTLYSGWRHFYFLNLCFVWFAAAGLRHVLLCHSRIIKWTLLAAEGLSLVITLFWIISAHPYEGVYYSLPFREKAADNFERDTGYISTWECLDYLAKNSQDLKIEVMNANAYIPFSLIGFPKSVRDRFETIDWKTQRIPMRYIIFNYNNTQGNEKDFPYYAPIYSIERNGTKLAEVFQRTNNGLLDPEGSILSVHASVNEDEADNILTEDSGTFWSGEDMPDPDESVTILLKNGLSLESVEVFPGEYAGRSESLLFETRADDSEEWIRAEAEKSGTNGWRFSDPVSGQLRIRSGIENGQPWQIRQILFYGKDGL